MTLYSSNSWGNYWMSFLQLVFSLDKMFEGFNCILPIVSFWPISQQFTVGGRVPGQVPSPRAGAPPGSYTPQQVHPPGWCTPQQVHPPAGTPPMGMYTPRQVHPQAGPPHGRYTPLAGTSPRAVHAGKYGQQVGGTHPTGMYSCLNLNLQLDGNINSFPNACFRFSTFVI